MAFNAGKIMDAIAGGGRVPIYKSSIANMGAGYICSLWRATGSPLWPQGAIPAGAATPTDDTVGGIVLPSFGTNKGRIYRYAPRPATPGTFMVYDRLAHMGGLAGNSANSQSVSLNAATAIAAGRAAANEIEWFVEIYTDIGTSAANLTINYTDVGDASKSVTITGFSGASPLNRVGRCVQIVTTDGIAIKSVDSVQLSVTSGTLGNFGITARKFLCDVGVSVANVLPPSIDAISIGMPEFKETACLEQLVLCSTTSTGVLLGSLVWGQVAE